MVSNIHRTKLGTGALALLMSPLFTGCGGGRATGPAGSTALVRVESEAPGSHCSAGSNCSMSVAASSVLSYVGSLVVR